MSGTTPAPTTASAASEWGAIIISMTVMVTFTGSLVVSFFFKDSGLLNLTVGAAIANATTAVGFWLGSSRGSQTKDAALATAATHPTIAPKETTSP
jgi:hypothetical protein